jgi:hypothetical protein
MQDIIDYQHGEELVTKSIFVRCTLWFCLLDLEFSMFDWLSLEKERFARPSLCYTKLLIFIMDRREYIDMNCVWHIR